MTERVTNQTMLGAAFAISATLPATYDAAGYGATAMVYTEVGEVETFGTHGAAAQVPTFIPVKTGIVQKFKGSKDYGKKSVVLAHLTSDAGQAILDAAMESVNRYSVKCTYPLGQGEATAEIQYFDVLVSKAEFVDGSTNDVRKRNFDIEICRKPTIVDAT